MPLDLVQAIKDDRALKHGGFTAAVLMTYTLNLNFFEQIVAPTALVDQDIARQVASQGQFARRQFQENIVTGPKPADHFRTAAR